MFTSAFGNFALQRYPEDSRSGLLAWSSADSLLLRAAAELDTAAENILVVNDEHGALATPLSGACIWTDSRLSELAIIANFASNRVDAVPRFCSMDLPPVGAFALVLMRVPKQMSLFRYQLQVLRQAMVEDCVVLCAGMDKHLPPAVASTMEEFLGPTERYPGERKARMFRITLDKSRTGCEPEYRGYALPGLPADVEARVNVFSREKLDAGSRLLLSEYSQLPRARRVADLGCGNGVLGMLAAQLLQPSSLVFIDESALALASARHNIRRLLPQMLQDSQFLQADGMRDYRAEAPDLILCNPPFHQQHVVDAATGQRLIRQAAAAIAPGGEFWLVANRHLPYGGLLQRTFRQTLRVTENSKFIVWRAVAAG